MENKIILYKDDEGKLSVNVRFADEDVWLTQAQLADIYNTTQQNISLHQKGIYADGELDENATHKKYLLVRQEGKRQVQREIDHYNLDMIIALDDQILRLRKNILEGTGTVSHQEAIEKAEREFEIYREREMRLLESDFDKAVKRLKNLNDESNELEN